MAILRRGSFEIPRDDYRIELDRRWKLEEFHNFTKNYEQAYFAYFVLYAVSEEGGQNDLLFRSVSSNLKGYPWQGGHSVVAFYTGVKRTIGRRNIPEVKAINYASPGYMDLLLQLPVAIQIAGTVTSIALSIGAVNKVYNDIYRGMRERQLNKVKVEREKLSLAQDEMKFLKDSCKELGQILQISDVDKLIEMSGNELRALKVLQSVFRRVRVLAKFQDEGKAILLQQNDRDDYEFYDEWQD